MLVLVLLGVLACKVAWGREQADPLAHDPWYAAGAGIGLVLGALSLAAAQQIREHMGERRKPSEPVQPEAQSMSPAEVRAMVTEGLQRLEREAEAQHRRIRESLREIEARLLRAEERITTNEHASAERRAEQARELGAIAADVRHLIKALE